MNFYQIQRQIISWLRHFLSFSSNLTRKKKISSIKAIHRFVDRRFRGLREPSRIVLIFVVSHLLLLVLKKVIVSESVIILFLCSFRVSRHSIWSRGVSLGLKLRLKRRKRRCESESYLKPLAFIFFEGYSSSTNYISFVDFPTTIHFRRGEGKARASEGGVKIYKFILINAQSKSTLWIDEASPRDSSFA